jgi:hypothetical protein
MTRRYDHNHFVAGKGAKLKVLAISFSSHQPQVNVAVFHLFQDGQGVAHCRLDLNVRIALAEDGKEPWQKVFAGNGAGAEA